MKKISLVHPSEIIVLYEYGFTLLPFQRSAESLGDL